MVPIGLAWTYANLIHNAVSSLHIPASSCFIFLIAASREQRLTPPLCVSDLSIYEPTQVSFYLLHWKKGTPVYYDQGKYDHLTFWEQIDGGSQFTSNKKFFTIIPIAM